MVTKKPVARSFDRTWTYSRGGMRYRAVVISLQGAKSQFPVRLIGHNPSILPSVLGI